MNVHEIIHELQVGEHLVEEQMPEDYIVHRREREYEGKLIDISEPYYLPPYSFQREDYPEEYEQRGNSNVGNYILISGGDIEELSDMRTEDIEEGLGSEGMEALAWYRSFHWVPSGRWGIYILDSSIYYLAKKVFRNAKQISYYGRPFNTLGCVQQSFRLLFLHEFFHFITDIAVSILEIGTSSSSPYYTDYIRNIYMWSHKRNEPLEEALANAFAYSKFYGRGVRSCLRSFMLKQPRGYEAFDMYLGKNFAKGRRELGTSISKNIRAARSLAPLECLFDCRHQDVFFTDVPVYIVPTGVLPQYRIKFVRAIHHSAIIQSPRFKRDINNIPPAIIPKYQKALSILGYNIGHRGLNFEKIRGCDTVFTIRIDRKYRLSLRHINEKWELLRIAEHDEVYKNPGV